jgi:hypothetical protein
LSKYHKNSTKYYKIKLWLSGRVVRKLKKRYFGISGKTSKSYLAVQEDGIPVFSDGFGNVYKTFGPGSGYPGAALYLQFDGNLLVLNSTRNYVWATWKYSADC